MSMPYSAKRLSPICQEQYLLQLGLDVGLLLRRGVEHDVVDLRDRIPGGTITWDVSHREGVVQALVLMYRISFKLSMAFSASRSALSASLFRFSTPFWN